MPEGLCMYTCMYTCVGVHVESPQPDLTNTQKREGGEGIWHISDKQYPFNPSRLTNISKIRYFYIYIYIKVLFFPNSLLSQKAEEVSNPSTHLSRAHQTSTQQH